MWIGIREKVAGPWGYFKFPGQGARDTPGAPLRTLVEIIMIAPGKNAKAFRVHCADMLARVFVGDMAATAPLSKGADAPPEPIPPTEDADTPLPEDVIPLSPPQDNTVDPEHSQAECEQGCLSYNHVMDSIRRVKDTDIKDGIGQECVGYGRVLDVIQLVSGQDRATARSTWKRMNDNQSEGVAFCHPFQFSAFAFPDSNRQTTPVAPLKTLIEIIMITPGKNAKAFRVHCAEMLSRVFDGDPKMHVHISDQIGNLAATGVAPALSESPQRDQLTYQQVMDAVRRVTCEEANEAHLPEVTGYGKVHDVLMLCTGQTRDEARKTWSRMKPGTEAKSLACMTFVFKDSNGHATPVAPLKTLIEIIMIAPGKHAKTFRVHCAETLCRVFAGDPNAQVVLEGNVMKLTPLQELNEQTTDSVEASTPLSGHLTYHQVMNSIRRITQLEARRSGMDNLQGYGRVLDVLVLCNNSTRVQARKDWYKIKEGSHLGDSLQTVEYFAFEGGNGQETPVAPLKTLIEIIMIAPGKNAKTFRVHCAEMLTRVFAGDPNMHVVIEKNYQLMSADCRRDLLREVPGAAPVHVDDEASTSTAHDTTANSAPSPSSSSDAADTWIATTPGNALASRARFQSALNQLVLKKLELGAIPGLESAAIPPDDLSQTGTYAWAMGVIMLCGYLVLIIKPGGSFYGQGGMHARLTDACSKFLDASSARTMFAIPEPAGRIVSQVETNMKQVLSNKGNAFQMGSSEFWGIVLPPCMDPANEVRALTGQLRSCLPKQVVCLPTVPQVIDDAFKAATAAMHTGSACDVSGKLWEDSNGHQFHVQALQSAQRKESEKREHETRRMCVQESTKQVAHAAQQAAYSAQQARAVAVQELARNGFSLEAIQTLLPVPQ